MSQLQVAAQGGATSNTPNIGKNLFWDDVRIGLNLMPWGVGLLLLGAVAGPWILPYWLWVALVLVGGLVMVLSIKICAAIPPESGVNLPAQGAMIAAVACLVTVVVCHFMGWPQPGLIAALALGAAAHVLFALVVLGCVRYLAHPALATLAGAYAVVALIYSVLLFVFFLMPAVRDQAQMQAGLALVSVLVAGFLMFLTSSASAALQRAQQGLPAVATAEEAAARAGRTVRADKPEPLPEEFCFTESEVEGFAAQDSTAGKAIVALMTGVFSVGVILYTIIAVMAAF